MVAAASADGHAPTLTGAGSTFDAPFFSVAFAKYEQQHPAVSIGYSAVGSSAGIAAFSAGQVDFGASDVPMTAAEQAAAKGGAVTQVPVRRRRPGTRSMRMSIRPVTRICGPWPDQVMAAAASGLPMRAPRLASASVLAR